MKSREESYEFKFIKPKTKTQAARYFCIYSILLMSTNMKSSGGGWDGWTKSEKIGKFGSK